MVLFVLARSTSEQLSQLLVSVLGVFPQCQDSGAAVRGQGVGGQQRRRRPWSDAVEAQECHGLR
jgi:hypothetical protein